MMIFFYEYVLSITNQKLINQPRFDSNRKCDPVGGYVSPNPSHSSAARDGIHLSPQTIIILHTLCDVRLFSSIRPPLSSPPPLFISLSYRSFPHYLIFPSPSSHYVLFFILFTFLSRGLHVFSHFDISHLYHAQCYFFPFGGTLTFRKNIQIFSCLNRANKAGMS